MRTIVSKMLPGFDVSGGDCAEAFLLAIVAALAGPSNRRVLVLLLGLILARPALFVTIS
jgi:hypothetical protein